MVFVDATSKTAMQQVVGAVCIVTTWDENLPWGLTVTSVCSLSAEPAMLIACINRQAEAHLHIRSSKRIGVNVLSEDQKWIAERFSSSACRGPQRFADLSWSRSPEGAPLIEGCLATFDCETLDGAECSSHTAFLCAVKRVITTPGKTDRSLRYFRRNYLYVGAVSAIEPARKHAVSADAGVARIA